jgi:hypothetical protein
VDSLCPFLYMELDIFHGFMSMFLLPGHEMSVLWRI